MRLRKQPHGWSRLLCTSDVLGPCMCRHNRPRSTATEWAGMKWQVVVQERLGPGGYRLPLLYSARGGRTKYNRVPVVKWRGPHLLSSSACVRFSLCRRATTLFRLRRRLSCPIHASSRLSSLTLLCPSSSLSRGSLIPSFLSSLSLFAFTFHRARLQMPSQMPRACFSPAVVQLRKQPHQPPACPASSHRAPMIRSYLL